VISVLFVELHHSCSVLLLLTTYSVQKYRHLIFICLFILFLDAGTKRLFTATNIFVMSVRITELGSYRTNFPDVLF